MQESCTYGSVRGAPGNGRPYRDISRKLDHIRICSLGYLWALASSTPQAAPPAATHQIMPAQWVVSGATAFDRHNGHGECESRLGEG
jgi:hypothetical protein